MSSSFSLYFFSKVHIPPSLLLEPLNVGQKGQLGSTKLFSGLLIISVASKFKRIFFSIFEETLRLRVNAESHLFRLTFLLAFEKCAHFYWPHSFFWCVVTVNNNTNTYSNLYFFFSLFSSPSHSPNSPPQSSLPKKTLHSTQHVKIKSLLHDLHPAFVQYCVHLPSTCRPRDPTLWVSLSYHT